MAQKLKDFLKAKEGSTIAIIVAAVLAGIGIVVVVEDSNNDGSPDKITITVNEKRDRAPALHPSETKLTVPKATVAEGAVGLDNTDKAMRDETPPLAPTRELVAAQKQQEFIQATDPLPLSFPLASTSYNGCATRFVRNQSSRNGVTPQQVWMHLTVSPNHPGRVDINSITALFDRASFSASSNFVVDRDGNCNYIVPTYRKSWTQAAANPIAISFEIINTGREVPFMKPAGYKQVGRTIARLHRQYHIPLQRGKVSGCRSIKKGIVMHKDGGICAGGHVDISPFSLTPVIKAAQRANCGYRKTAKSKRHCLRKVSG